MTNRDIAMRGGEGILTLADIPDLKAGTRRVFNLMKDGRWYLREEIEEAAQGVEGMKRMRELRGMGYTINKFRVPGTRQWRYQLARKGHYD